MGVPENLDALMVKFDIPASSIARAAGVSEATVSGWRRGAQPRKANLEKLCRYFNITEDDILSDSFGLAAKEHGDFGDLPPNAMSALASSSVVPVKVLGLTCMGEGDIGDCDESVEVPSFVVANHPSLFIVHGIGSCLNRRYPEDAALGIDPDMRPKSGDAVLVTDEAHGSVVRVYYRGGAGTVMLSADSYEDVHEDIIIGPDDPPVRVVGVVVWYQAYEDVRR